MRNMDMQDEILDMIKNRIGEDFYIAKGIALSMTRLAMGMMTEDKLKQWAEKLRKDVDHE